MYHKLQDVEWLKTEYVDKLRTLQSIGDEVGCNKATIGRTLKKYGISRRKRTSRHAKLNDKDWLRKAYVEDGRSISSLAREAGCTVGPVRDALHALGIETRGSKAAYEISTQKRLGSTAGNWQGGRRILRTGYVYIYAPDHPYATKSGYVMEHRLVMEKRLGRYLEPHELVHHINGLKGDNRDENLQLTENGTHISDHFKSGHEANVLRQRVAELEAEVARLKAENEQPRKHILKWMAMPYDINKGGAYYLLVCLACNESFGESFIPSLDGRLMLRDGCQASRENRARAIEWEIEYGQNATP